MLIKHSFFHIYSPMIQKKNQESERSKKFYLLQVMWNLLRWIKSKSDVFCEYNYDSPIDKRNFVLINTYFLPCNTVQNPLCDPTWFLADNTLIKFDQ